MTPSRPKYVAYFRVSTERQGRSGLGLEAQQAAVQQYLEANHGALVATFTEVESGKVNDRPQLQAALVRCRQTRATLVVAKLDRLSRDAGFLLTLRNGDVKFQALDIPEANTLTIGVMAVLAQHEREIISQRTKAALAARRARGLPLGTPRDMSAYAVKAGQLGNAVKRERSVRHAREVLPVIKEARSAGNVSLRQIAAYLNDRQITTPRGAAWTANAVRLAVMRADRGA